MWADRPAWAGNVAEREDIYTIDLDDGTHLVLAQLADTTYVVARLDPPGSGVRRLEPDGELVGEYASLREAVREEPAD